jgi:hypothetical protein
LFITFLVLISTATLLFHYLKCDTSVPFCNPCLFGPLNFIPRACFLNLPGFCK